MRCAVRRSKDAHNQHNGRLLGTARQDRRRNKRCVALDVELKTDIDFAAAQKQLDKPMGIKSEISCTQYSGTFNENNHKVVGMKMNFTWALGGAGLFCGVTNATFKDLTFDETCSIASNGTAAMLSAMGYDVLTLENIRNEGSVTATNAAGIIGVFNGPILMVVRCVTSGTIAGNKKTQNLGGIVSEAMDQ